MWQHRIAARARSGIALSAAAKASGAEATTLAAQDQSAYAGLAASPAIAKAAFAAAKGAILDPQKSPLGWLVVQVDAINRTGGKSLSDERAALSAQIVKQKVDVALADLVTKLEDAVADGSTFDDVIKAEGLSVETTPALTASGIAPDVPGFKAAAELQSILHDGFQAEVNDDAAADHYSGPKLGFTISTGSILQRPGRSPAFVRRSWPISSKTVRCAKQSGSPTPSR
ncbi:MAG: peptidyl-prolyl cis-trans isomerase [Sphingomonadales bacterium]|nr:peptidyl-prolyl cis-trans isomerase [Sphingomonadales bacterium]